MRRRWRRCVGRLRVGGGAGGVGQPSNIVIGRNYHRGQRCGVTGRERVGTDGQRAEIGIVVPDPLGHRCEVEAVEVARSDEERGSGLTTTKADLAVAIDRDDRVLDGTEAGKRTSQHNCVDPGWEDPGHDIAGPNADIAKACGHLGNTVAILAVGALVALPGEKHRLVGPAVCCVVDKFDERRGGRGHACSDSVSAPLARKLDTTSPAWSRSIVA